MAEMSTKEKLQYAALDLFSMKGYAATSVDEIAESVGMKGPIIYKYFKGKEDLLYSIVTLSDERYREKMMMESAVPIWIHNGAELKEFSLHQINYTVDNEMIVKIRRMSSIEQFRNTRLAKEASKHQVDNIISMFSRIFKFMMDNGAIDECDPELMALEFTSPTSVLIQLCDREPERKDEAMALIEKHIDFFIAKYCKK